MKNKKIWVATGFNADLQPIRGAIPFMLVSTKKDCQERINEFLAQIKEGFCTLISYDGMQANRGDTL